MRVKTLLAALAGGVGIAAAIVGGSAKKAHADDPDVVAKRERCAIRVAIAFSGKSPTDALMASPDPTSGVDGFLTSPEFYDRYASFINRSFNRLAGPSPEADASYWVAYKVLETKKPWKDLFIGPYNVANVDGKVVVKDDPNGLGYFRTEAWLRKYAGNEGKGIKLATAFRLISNTVGLKVEAVQALPGQDTSAAGREGAACRGCHFDSWFALDKVANVLTRRVGTGNDFTFGPPQGGPQTVFDGVSVKDDKDIVTTLVGSEQFLLNQCRLAFTFLYGRPENSCEGAIVDKCMEVLKTQGTIQAGLSAIAKEPAFCE